MHTVMSKQATALKPADLGRQLVETMHTLQALQEGDQLAVMSQSGLTIAQLIALHVLAHRGAHTVGGIAACVRLSPAATSHLVDRLVQRGLVARLEHAVDRRQKQVSLSSTGRALIERLDRARLTNVTGLVAHLSPGLRGRAATVLSEMVAELAPQLAARQATGPCAGLGPVARGRRAASSVRPGAGAARRPSRGRSAKASRGGQKEDA
jgi:DNA-binding MarR family transcriptional regulator